MFTDNDCELCHLERKSIWYYENTDFIICDCLTCKTPMIVFKRHGPARLDEQMRAHEVVVKIFGSKFLAFRKKCRKVLDHPHWHIFLK